MTIVNLVVHVAILASLGCALCGCGGTPVPEPEFDPAPSEDPDVMWQRFMVAFENNDLGTLKAFYKEGKSAVHQWTSNERHLDFSWKGKRIDWISKVEQFYPRTNKPAIRSSSFDISPAEPDRRFGSIVWSGGNLSGYNPRIDALFAVDILVFEYDRWPGKWVVNTHAQVIDVARFSGDSHPPLPDEPCPDHPVLDDPLGKGVCNDDLDGTLTLFDDNATLRSYDEEGGANLRGLFSKDKLRSFFQRSALFEDEFPPRSLIDTGYGVMTLSHTIYMSVGPASNAYPQFPRRFFSFVVSENNASHPPEEGDIKYLFLARWNWTDANEADSFVAMV